MTCIMMWIDAHAAAIQAIGSIVGIAIAIAVPAWQTRAARRAQAADRRRSARVLAMELLPTVDAIREDSAEMIGLGG
jgi:hypothetical protein